jgi:hypothetical protein
VADVVGVGPETAHFVLVVDVAHLGGGGTFEER